MSNIVALKTAQRTDKVQPISSLAYMMNHLQRHERPASLLRAPKVVDQRVHNVVLIDKQGREMYLEAHVQGSAQDAVNDFYHNVNKPSVGTIISVYA